jgi:AcrR family transcriptional regulator
MGGTCPVTSEASPTTAGKKARTRQTILAAAGDLFARQGIQPTTMDEIATAADLSVGALYKHFGGKEAVALAFIAESLDVLGASIDEARSTASPIARVYAAGDAYFRFAMEHPAASRFAMIRVLQPTGNPEFEKLHQEMSGRTQRLVLGIAADLKAAMVAGQIPTAPIDETMVLLWGIWSGITTLVVRQDGSAIPPELAQRSFARAQAMMRRAAAHTLMFPGDAETWPTAAPGIA